MFGKLGKIGSSLGSVFKGFIGRYFARSETEKREEIESDIKNEIEENLNEDDENFIEDEIENEIDKAIDEDESEVTGGDILDMLPIITPDEPDIEPQSLVGLSEDTLAQWRTDLEEEYSLDDGSLNDVSAEDLALIDVQSKYLSDEFDLIVEEFQLSEDYEDVHLLGEYVDIKDALEAIHEAGLDDLVRVFFVGDMIYVYVVY